MKHQTSNSNRKCLDCSDFMAGLPRQPSIGLAKEGRTDLCPFSHNLNLNRCALTSFVLSTLRSLFSLRLKFSDSFFSSASFPSLTFVKKFLPFSFPFFVHPNSPFTTHHSPPSKSMIICFHSRSIVFSESSVYIHEIWIFFVAIECSGFEFYSLAVDQRITPLISADN
jgi:hypothetical protein